MIKIIFALSAVLLCGTFFVINADAVIMSLKQQIKEGVSFNEILCPNNNHVLVERTNGKLSCVYPSTAEKLNWRKIVFTQNAPNDAMIAFDIQKNDETFYVEFLIDNGVITDIQFLENSNSLMINIDSSGDGQVTLHIPHGIIDPIPKDSGDYVMFVIINGVEVDAEQSTNDKLDRSLTIKFQDNNPEIEIIGAYWV